MDWQALFDDLKAENDAMEIGNPLPAPFIYTLTLLMLFYSEL